MTRSSAAVLHEGFEDPERELKRGLRAQALTRKNQDPDFDFDLEELFREVEVLTSEKIADLFF